MKRKIVIGVVTAAVLIGGGTATAVALADDDGGGTARAAASRVTVGEAVAAGRKAVPGTVTEAELDEEDGRLRWELEVYGADKVWRDVTVDAESGKVLGKRVDRDEDDSRSAPRTVSVSLEEAAGAALKSVPGVVTSVELEGRHGGAAHWETDVRGKDGGEHELSVDALTGVVTADGRDED
ncbi:PepSY domain-containing protein [Streptomyces sp. NBC_00726]|uniref:PepSY domain-containing protein n=1 Tax=Streptomyces sp. NBC_00726 TaxID=2903674 RepID=UPI00386F2BB2